MQWRACTQCNIGLAYCHLFAIIVNYYTFNRGNHKVCGILEGYRFRFASWHSVPRGRFENALKWGLLESHATNEAGLSIRSFDMQGAYRLDAWNLCVLGVLWWQILGVLRWQMRTAASKQQNSRFFSIVFGLRFQDFLISDILRHVYFLLPQGLYTFDMRKLSAATSRHWDHVMAVLDVDYAPNGSLAILSFL